MTERVSATFPDALQRLLAGAIDYAGLFPPTGLAMADAVANYAAYRAGGESWALGRFVLPLARLDEFLEAADPVAGEGATDAPWRLSVLVEPGTPAQLKALHDFHGRGQGRFVVDCIEGKAATAEQVLPYGRFREAGLEVFVEIPVADDPEPMLRAVAEGGLSAKIRTGGITPEAFPSARDVARFLASCRDTGVPFKATAGLHHPLRAEYRLTYDRDGVSGTMFGYLNVMLAAALAWSGAPARTVVRMLEERNAGSLRFTAEGVHWRDWLLESSVIDAIREFVVRGFGSCSFREPLDEFAALHRHDAC